MKNFKFVLLLLVLIVISLGVFYFFSYKSSLGALIKAVPVELSVPIEGKIVELNVQNNAYVKKGEQLLKIDDTIYQKELEKAKNKLDEFKNQNNFSNDDIDKLTLAIGKGQTNVKESKIKLDEAKKQLERANNDYIIYKNAFEYGSVTKRDFQNAANNLALAREQFDEAKNDLEKNSEYLKQTVSKKSLQEAKLKKLISDVDDAELNLSYTTVTSPDDGIVLYDNLSSGDNILKNKHFISIIPNNYFIIAQFDNNLKIKKGQKAYVIVDNKKYKAVVEDITKENVKLNFTSDTKDAHFLPDTKAVVKVKLF